MRSTLAIGPNFFVPVEGFNQHPNASFAKAVTTIQRCVCYEKQVAVWFGGMLAAAEQKDEIADWLLRHVPAR